MDQQAPLMVQLHQTEALDLVALQGQGAGLQAAKDQEVGHDQGHAVGQGREVGHGQEVGHLAVFVQAVDQGHGPGPGVGQGLEVGHQ